MNQCSICLEEIPEGEKITLVKCGHSFCKSCIDELFNRNLLNCPLCRSEIREYLYKENIIHIIIRNIENTQSEDNQPENNPIIIYNNYRSFRFMICQWLLIVSLFVYIVDLRELNKDLLEEISSSNYTLEDCIEIMVYNKYNQH